MTPCLVFFPHTQRQYLVLVPFLIHTETTEKICVQLNHLNESVTLKITLEYGGRNKSLIRDVLVAKTDHFQCIPFMVRIRRWNRPTDSPVVLLTVSVKGDTLSFWSRKTVLVQNLDNLVFVQTDKPIYKPGQEVMFRIASMDENFHPLNGKDPKRNRLFQWQNVELKVGLVQLSFPLTSEPKQGTYKVVVKKPSGSNVEQTFEVKEYVFFTIQCLLSLLPCLLLIHRYTYGKPVPGLVKVQICRPYSSPWNDCYGKESEAVCKEFSGEADGQGCLTRVVQTSLFQLKRSGYKMNLRVEGTIVEEGTGMELNGSAFTDITRTLSKATFENLDPYYKPGIPFQGQVRPVGSSLLCPTLGISCLGANTKYHTHVNADHLLNNNNNLLLLFDHQNLSPKVLNLLCYVCCLFHQAKYKSTPYCYDRNWEFPSHHEAYFTAFYFYSPSRSYLHIESVSKTLNCEQNQAVRVHYVLNLDVIKDEKIVFHYLVCLNGAIGMLECMNALLLSLDLLSLAAKGVFALDLALSVHMAPVAHLLVYTILPNGELLAHSADFVVENCFSNKVRLWFSDSVGLPASKTQLHLAASEGSLCAVHAVDKSVFILKPKAELSSQTVYKLLPVQNLNFYRYESWAVDDPDSTKCIHFKTIFVGGIGYYPINFSFYTGDAYKILQVKLTITLFPSAYALHEPGPPGSPMFGYIWYLCNGSNREFPTVFYFLVTYNRLDANDPDSTGEISIPVTIPDTITEWRAGAYCMSAEAGFGLASPVALKAFQPFFLDLTMPYSVVRGEKFILKATVFTYLPRCLRVKMMLDPSPDFTASPEEKEEESHCVCANGRKTVSWMVTPRSLGEVKFTASAEALSSDQPCGNEIVEIPSEGKKDTLIKSLIVEVCVCVLAAFILGEKLPENVVEESARASFCVLGDILGSAIQNLHQLLRMPYGCGEQNMALFAPNIYILKYLNNTRQLTEDIKSKAIGYLVSGYQRQLNYKHSDGSYSTFGERRGEPGNAWLTAFVLRSMAQAKNHIFVEQSHISDAQAWLAVRQKENGCFQSSGTLLNNALKGGVDDEVSLSAYTTIALLEMPLPVTHSVVRNALFCLETAAESKEINVYTRALMAYAFALAGKEEKRDEMLRLLHAVAVEEDGSLHWQRPKKLGEEKEDLPSYYHRAPSAEVEMTSYVLMAYLTKRPAPSEDDLKTATQIVLWLIKQQNPTGGFSSTQDTMVALQALSLYSALTFVRSSKGVQVTLNAGENALKQFQVERDNRLLLQCQAVPKLPGDYRIEVTGEGCVFAQTTLKYNVQPCQEEVPFALEVHTVPETCTGPKANKVFNLAINVSYTGKRPVSNMAIVDVKMLSGYIPSKPSVRKLENHNLVQRTETSSSHVLIYLEKVSKESYTFTIEQDVPVQGLKPALVKVYDYYETDEFALAEYNAPCNAGKV
uniref:Alpha-2-macroglobulin n=1 Tax=Anolis carolinensis TaxID=28377 RepID=A0A803TTX6_ANOCA